MIEFIKPSEVIERIRETISIAEADLSLPDGFVTYADRVGGSAEANAITQENVQSLPSPSVFVTLIDGSALTNSYTDLDQDIYHGFSIIVILNTKDSRKQTAEETIVTMKELLLYCLNGWKPIKYTSANSLRYTDDYTIATDRTTYVQAFNFIYTTHFIASEDGLGVLPEEYNIENFDTFFANLFATETGLDGMSIGVEATDLYGDEEDE